LKFPKTTPNLPQYSGDLPSGNGAHFSEQLLESALKDNDTVLKERVWRLSEKDATLAELDYSANRSVGDMGKVDMSKMKVEIKTHLNPAEEPDASGKGA